MQALWKTGGFLELHIYLLNVSQNDNNVEVDKPDPLHDPAIPRLDIYPRVKKIYTHKYVLGCSQQVYL